MINFTNYGMHACCFLYNPILPLVIDNNNNSIKARVNLSTFRPKCLPSRYILHLSHSL